jgi:hypothetical protein
MAVELGDKVKDVITGLEGIVTAIAEHLVGCRRMIVQPKGITDDGKMKESYWVDEPNLKVLERAHYQGMLAPKTETPPKQFVGRPGGPPTRIPAKRASK